MQIEQRLRELVNRNALGDRGTAKRYLEDLGRADALQTSSMNDLRQFVGIANRAIHGVEIKPNSAGWAVEHGPTLVKQLTTELNCM